MVSTLLAALTGEKVLYRSIAAAVTANCVTFRTALPQQTYMLSLAHPVGIRKVTTTYPGLLIVSLGLLILSAGDYCSPHHARAYVPLAVLSLAFVIAYFRSRRAALIFFFGPETIATRGYSLRQTTAMIQAIQCARIGESEPVKELEPVTTIRLDLPIASETSMVLSLYDSNS